MNLELKRNNLWELISKIQDEQLRAQIMEQIKLLLSNQMPPQKEPTDDFIAQYRTEIKPDFDLEAILKEQNYTGSNQENIDKIAAEIEIPQSIEEILEMS